MVGKQAKDVGDGHIKLGGVGNYLRTRLEEAGSLLTEF